MNKNRKSEHLKNDLQERINTGLIKPGECIPSENRLCEQYGITRPTVRKVLAELCQIGLLEKRPGSGTFVCDQNAPPADFFREMRIGSEIFFRHSEYYSLPLFNGIQGSSYVRNCYFTPLKNLISSKSQLRQVDALLVSHFSPKIQLVTTEFKKPIVALNHVEETENVGMIYVDHYSEAKRGVDCLIKYGCRKIVLVGDDSYQDPVTLARRDGWADAFVENNLEMPGPEYRILFKDIGLQCDDSFMEQLKKLNFDALFFTKGSAFLTTHVYLKNYYGKKINDFKILIFDDLSMFNIFKELSVVFIKQPLEEQGALAIEYLRNKAFDPAYPVINKKLGCKLIIQ